MTVTQALIFTATVLGLSVATNVLLIFDQSTLQATIDAKDAELDQLNIEIDNNEKFKTEQLDRLNQMGGDQKQLGDFISELQTELTLLNYEYQRTKETASQTQIQLSNAKKQIDSLQSNLELQNRELENAKATIANQQRALKRSQSQQASNPEISFVAQGLSTEIPKISNDLTVTETSSGEVIVNIPLSELFDTDTLNINNDAENYLTIISNYLSNYPSINANVIGHSDSRPIVSDLANSYPTNWELSSARASKVVNFLIDNGIEDSRLTASGKAANEPVRDSENSEAYSINRRVEIRLY